MVTNSPPLFVPKRNVATSFSPVCPISVKSRSKKSASSYNGGKFSLATEISDKHDKPYWHALQYHILFEEKQSILGHNNHSFRPLSFLVLRLLFVCIVYYLAIWFIYNCITGGRITGNNFVNSFCIWRLGTSEISHHTTVAAMHL